MLADASVPDGGPGRSAPNPVLTWRMVNQGTQNTPAASTDLLLQLIELAQTLSQVLSSFAARHGLTENDCYALAMLSRHDAITAKSLGILCHMHKTRVSRVMRSLEQRELISCGRNNLDQRKVTLALTARGAALGNEISIAAGELTHRLELKIPQAERGAVFSALEQITGRMKEILRHDMASRRPQRIEHVR
jgi:DNA-binding MarR family transcriptional regulator